MPEGKNNTLPTRRRKGRRVIFATVGIRQLATAGNDAARLRHAKDAFALRLFRSLARSFNTR